MARPSFTTLALAGAGLATAAAVAAVRADRRWRAAADPCAGTELDRGEPFSITVDDGAVLDGALHGPDDGPLVVLSHCWTGNREIWAPVAARLVASGHRVALYDQRGHGRSTWGADSVEVNRLGSDLAAVLEAIDARDAVIAGHSMGGMSLQALAVEHPEVLDERVGALALVATSAGGLGASPLARVGPRVIGAPAIERAMRSRFGHALVRRTVGAEPRYGHLDLTRSAFVATAGPVRRGLLEAMLRMDLRAGLSAVTAPTAVVYGPRDMLTPRAMAHALAEAIPHATLVEAPGAGHMLPLERPDLVADVIVALADRRPVDEGIPAARARSA
jgi:non-heme chloroperoxidase